MTMGTKTSNNLMTHPGGGQFGTYWTKAWNGGNNVPRTPLTDHNYVMTARNEEYSAGWWARKSSPNVHYPQGMTALCGTMPFSYLNTEFTANDQLRLIGKLSAKVRGGSFNLGNFLGESRQTFALVGDTAYRLAKMLHYIRDGNFYSAKRTLLGGKSNISIARGHVLDKRNRKPIITVRNASDMVLELQYGWRPLLGDVHDSMSQLAQKLELPYRDSYKVVIKKKDEFVLSRGGYRFVQQAKALRAMKVHLTAPISTHTALHLNDPLGVMWEITPWSFIADWFLPISDYLNAIDFLRNFQVDRVVTTTFYVTKAELLSYSSPAYIAGWDGDNKGDAVSLRREVGGPLTFASIPVPQFKSLSKALGPEHVLNGIALLGATASGFKSKLKF
jgi:hypothetical protein